MKRGLSQAFGIGIVARAMITIEELMTARELMCRRMPKFSGRFFHADGHQYRIMRDAAERHDGRAPGQFGNLIFKILITSADFSWRGFILWRQTFHRVTDTTVDEFEVVVHVPCGGERIGLRREAEMMQARIQQLASGISRKWPSSAIGAMHTGC